MNILFSQLKIQMLNFFRSANTVITLWWVVIRNPKSVLPNALILSNTKAYISRERKT